MMKTFFNTTIRFAVSALFLVGLVSLVNPNIASAQRFGYIDSQKILERLPEYSQANSELEEMTKQWKAELAKKQQEILDSRTKLEAERVLLTEEMYAEKQKEIAQKETDLITYRESIFGANGLLFKKRRELIRPIQDKIMEAVRIVSLQKKLHFMFDKASDLHMLFYDETYNFTDFVLEELGIQDPNISIDKG
ncbi:OmpH family outer membrane protein [Bernardetia sp.]|uniref:OmpH family outer membrane protein n=1 Tax=Bernardetia sp. TaxID=1937974 RepID=UPI0025BC73CE|nr:OmpH family outer membrane protein [Bernardetia sp.]